MKNFFSRIKGLLKHDYGGRYLAIVLKEVLEEDSVIASCLIGNKNIKNDSYYVQVEWSFPDRNRIADLAIFDKISNEVIGLVEIKYEDEKSLGTDKQLDDYLDYCKIHKISFTYLTKNIPPKADFKKITNNYISYAKLVHRIENKNKISYAGKMLCSFLREEGYVFDNRIDETALLLLMVNSLSFTNRHGFGQLNTLKRVTKDVPAVFGAVLSNTSVLASRFYEDKAFEIFKKSPRIDYKFTPSFDIEKTQKRISALVEKGEEYSTINKKEIVSGSFYSFANLKLPGEGPWLYLCLGYEFEVTVNSNQKKPINCYLFAELVGAETKFEDEYKYSKIKIGLDEDESYKTLLKLVSKVLNSTKENKYGTMSEGNKIAIKKLAKNIK